MGKPAALVLFVLVAAAAGGQRTGARRFANFTNIATRIGVTARTVIGEENIKRFLLESTGGAAGVFDYDNDGWLDIFLTNGSRVEGFPPGHEPTNHLYRNRANGTFQDVTREAGLQRGGWAQGVCAGDYNGDGFLDLLVTYYGHNVLYRNTGSGSFTEVTESAGLREPEPRWGTGCTFVDYDRDGDLDLFVSNYADYRDGLSELPDADRVCRWKGMRVFCGPKGLRGSRPVLYRNLGNGRFEDVTVQSHVADVPPGYGFAPIAADFDNDGWPDIYVAHDTAPNLLFRNKRDGTFEEIGLPSFTAFNDAGLMQAGMGVDVADYNGDGLLDIVKTNFSDDIPNLYRNLGDGTFSDESLGSGLHANPHYLGWGVTFADVDADGWPDVLIANGHVYPGVERVEHSATYKQRILLYRNLGNGKFEDVSSAAGSALVVPRASRGLAVGDLFNQGRLDFVINNMWETPTVLSNTLPAGNHWIEVQLVGVQTNAHGIGSRVTVTSGGRSQFNEVRSGGSFCSQNDLRLYFGLGAATRVEKIEVHWLGGKVESYSNVPADHLLVVREGAGITVRKPHDARSSSTRTGMPLAARSLIPRSDTARATGPGPGPNPKDCPYTQRAGTVGDSR